jgi:hypothetical protein
MIAMIQGKSNEVRLREDGYNHYHCAVDRRVVPNEESKEIDPL